MKKILFTFLLFSFCEQIYAIEDIKINNDNLVPYFDNSIKRYNYFTDNDTINIYVKKSKNEEIDGDGKYNISNGINKFIINSNIYGEYNIYVYKNYKENKDSYGVLNSLYIKNYDINFKSDIYEYEIVINDEDYLDIEYELENDNSYVEITGNGNFNKGINTIIINVDNINNYKINVLKTSSVFKSEEIINKIEDISPLKKEIVKLIIITISCTLVFCLFYFLFIK